MVETNVMLALKTHRSLQSVALMGRNVRAEVKKQATLHIVWIKKKQDDKSLICDSSPQ
jgi:hypothetical protein